MSRSLPVGIGRMLVSVLTFLAQAVAAQQAQESSWQQVQLKLGGPTLETTIAGFELKGPSPLDILTVDDLDILLIDAQHRLVPLLHLLDILRVEVRQHGDSVKFQPPGVATRILDFRRGRLTYLHQSEQTVALKLGISDATWQAEIFVQDTVASQILSIPLQWDQSKYGYNSKTSKIFEVFAENHKPRRSLLSYMSQSEQDAASLPEKMPPAQPSANSDLLTFVQFRMFGSANGQRNPSAKAFGRSGLLAMNYTMYPQLQTWGRLFGGNYSFELAKNVVLPSSFYRSPIQFRGEWTKSLADLGVTLGDNNISLGDLIFPYLAFRGVAFGGAAGMKTRATGRAGLDARQYLSPIQVFDGYAPLGSIVELHINGRLHDQREVQQDVRAPSGQGSYRFDGVNLLTGYTNEVRIVIKRPDGLRQEIRREVLGTEKLLKGGQWALLGGMGRQRLWLLDGYRTQGFFAGGRFLYGLTNRMTVGLTGALQQDINHGLSFLGFSDRVSQSIPEQSYHSGAELAFRLNDHVVASGAIVSSLTRGDSAMHFGGQFGAEIQLGPLRLEPRVFRIDPGFYDGVNPLLQDREGYSFKSYLTIARKWRLQLTSGQIRDNVRQQAANTNRINFQQAKFSFSELLPRSNLDFTAEHRRIFDQADLMTYDIETRTSLPLNLNLSTRFRLGGERPFLTNSDLFAVPSLSYLPFYENRGVLLNLNWDPPSPSNFYLNHWQSTGFERTLLTYSYNSPVNQRWQALAEIGRDWVREYHFGQARLEYSLDGWGENRVGLLSRYDGFWSLEFTFQLKNLFGLYPGGINRLTNVRLEPGQGGVWGQTFLDLNANGVPDSGEPGLSGIDVVVNGQWLTRTKSNKNGFFLATANAPEDSLRISLNAKLLPAIYTVTQGTQLALLESGAFTRVFLGVASLGSISGKVYERTPEGELRGVSGIRVILVRADSLQQAGDSITAQDGGYYIGEVRPGEYLLTIDARYLPTGFFIADDAIAPQERLADSSNILQRLGIDSKRFPQYVIRKVHMASGVTPVDLEKLDFILTQL